MLEGKVAIVTGGASGLGRAGALALAKAGAGISVWDLDVDRGQAVVQEIEGSGAAAKFIRVDVTSSAQVSDAVSETVDVFGGVHVLYNNAGVALVGRDGFTAEMSEEDWDRVIRVNLTSVFLCSKHAIPAMEGSGGGSIINTASSMAHLPLGALDAYAASKGGVAMLTKSMAVGCARRKIRVNAISPGYVNTPMNALIWSSPELKAAFERGHLLGLQEPEDVAKTVVFLASDASVSLTGAVLNCDAGWTAFKQPDMPG